MSLFRLIPIFGIIIALASVEVSAEENEYEDYLFIGKVIEYDDKLQLGIISPRPEYKLYFQFRDLPFRRDLNLIPIENEILLRNVTFLAEKISDESGGRFMAVNVQLYNEE